MNKLTQNNEYAQLLDPERSALKLDVYYSRRKSVTLSYASLSATKSLNM